MYKKAGAMCEKSGSFNSKSVPTYRTHTFTKKAYRTRTITEKAYRTSVPYFLAEIEAYRTVPWCHPCLQALIVSSEHDLVFALFFSF